MIGVEQFILTELERHGIEYEIHRDFIHVSCPFHEHSGQKKKLGFSRSSGGMNCWVCGKKGHFNEYAELMKLGKLKEDDGRLQDFNFIKQEIERIHKKSNREPENPDFVRPWDREHWRGLAKDFLDTIPSYLWFDEQSKADRILWPIFMNGEFRGCTSARIRPTDSFVLPKTRNLGGMDSARVLFPFDHPLVRESKAVVLVEGQFDALRLLYHGIPAVSIMGTGSWDRCKLTFLGARKIERLVLAFDGDLPGEKMTDEVESQAASMFDVRVLPFPNPDDEELARGIKAIDPGNCKRKYLKLLKRMTR